LTPTIFVPVFATTTATANLQSNGLLREVEGADPVTFSINALRNSCSAMPVLGSEQLRGRADRRTANRGGIAIANRYADSDRRANTKQR